MQQMLISDANILIDLECCQLVEKLFTLPFYFCTPDILFATELQKQHAHLPSLGLNLLSLTPESVMLVSKLRATYTKVSVQDLMVLSLAKQESCPLLTGDRALRAACDKEGVIIFGTIWILKQLVIHKTISLEIALNALIIMEENGRRLPFDIAKEQLLNLS